MSRIKSRSLMLSLLGALLTFGCSHSSPLTVVPVSDQADQDTTAPPPGAEPDRPTVTLTHGPEVPDQLIVAVKPGTRVVLAADNGPKPIREFDLDLHYQVVQVPAGMSRDEAIARLKTHPNVQMVMPNHVYNASLTPNDSMYSSQWSMKRTNATKAWDKGVNTSNVTVAVLDTGIDYDHPEFAGRVIKGPDIADNDSDPMDKMGHGTHVAGIIGASGNNGIGVAGVAWNCKLLAVKVLGDKGNGTTDYVAEGIKYAADHGARVINLSLGNSDASGLALDPVLHQAMVYAHQKNVLVVAAAGNEHGEVHSPANDPNAIAVSSTSNFLFFEWMSMFSNHGDKVEVAAPGGGIYSTLPTHGSQLGSNYGKLSGTSMAAPFVSGEAALIIAQHPTWTVDQVRARIDQAVDDKGASGRDEKYGFGRINLSKALQ
jgi:thermitase